jgi:agmatinase
MLYNARHRMKPKKSANPHPEPVDALVLPRFSGVPTFMRLPHIPRAEELDIAILGIPFDGGTTYRPGARFGPRHIRVQSAMIRPWNPVLEVNPFRKWRIADLGDLSINPLSIEDTYGRITAQLSEVLRAKAHPVSVGGDHSILLPILRAVHRHYGQVGLIQLDAHGDTWGGYFGSPHSHGTPVKHAVEEGLIAKGYGLQVGLRGQVYSDQDFEFARKHRIQMVTAEQFHKHGVEPVRRLAKKLRNVPVYLTLDIDVVDPAFAPGTGTPQVGGLSSAQVLDLVRCFAGLNLVACDLVEVSPSYDNGEITSLLAANLLFELLCLF